MEKVVRVFRSFEEAEQAEREYYRSLTPQERLAILAELNKMLPGAADGEDEGRVTKVCRITKLK